MIDRSARDDLAFHLRRLATGQITNDEFDDRLWDVWMCSEDAAVVEIAEFGWCLYDDLRTYRLTGRYALPKDARRRVARAILFLQSDQDYEWPPVEAVAGEVVLRWMLRMGLFVSAFLTNGIVKLVSLAVELLLMAWSLCRRLITDEDWEAEEEERQPGDHNVWPFYRVPDFDEAREKPKFLIGKQGA